MKETLRFKVGKRKAFCKSGSVLVFTNHTTGETTELNQQIVGLSQNFELEVSLLTRLPTEAE